MDSELHHFSKKISTGNLEFALDLFSQLDCRLFYRKKGARWALIEPTNQLIKIQLIESDSKPLPTKEKENSHMGFVARNPEQEIRRMKQWIESQDKKCIIGSWSDKELYFDCPDVFVDFVVEIMNRSLIED